jgi:hypothetical protein
VTEGSGGPIAPAEGVVTPHLTLGDGALELPQRGEDELGAVRDANRPSLARAAADGRPDLELETAVRALDGGAPPADERVIELVFGLATLALDVHRRSSRDSTTQAALVPGV